MSTFHSLIISHNQVSLFLIQLKLDAPTNTAAENNQRNGEQVNESWIRTHDK